MKKKTDPNKIRDPQMFMDYFCRVPTHFVVGAMNTLTRGISWRGCTKKHMAECWADPWLGHESLQTLELETIWAEIQRQRN